jgi:hypothetical protein
MRTMTYDGLPICFYKIGMSWDDIFGELGRFYSQKQIEDFWFLPFDIGDIFYVSLKDIFPWVE